MLSDQAKTLAVVISGCQGDQYMQILLDVSVHVPLSVGHRLFDLRLGSNDYLPFCCERADTVEFALQTLYFEENGDVRQRRLCHIVLTAGALRPCCTWPRRGLVAGPGPRTDQQSERRDGAVSTDIQHKLYTHKDPYVCRATGRTWQECWAQ